MFVFLPRFPHLSIQMNILRTSVALTLVSQYRFLLGLCRRARRFSSPEECPECPRTQVNSDITWGWHQASMLEGTVPEAILVPVLPSCWLHLLSFVPIFGFSWFAIALEVREIMTYPYLKGSSEAEDQGLKEWESHVLSYNLPGTSPPTPLGFYTSSLRPLGFYGHFIL